MSKAIPIDKTAFSIADLRDADDDKQYWRSRTPLERLQAVEVMRQILYGYNPGDPVQRVLEVGTLQEK
jgi:hypothetical protein